MASLGWCVVQARGDINLPEGTIPSGRLVEVPLERAQRWLDANAAIFIAGVWGAKSTDLPGIPKKDKDADAA